MLLSPRYVTEITINNFLKKIFDWRLKKKYSTMVFEHLQFRLITIFSNSFSLNGVLLKNDMLPFIDYSISRLLYKYHTCSNRSNSSHIQSNGYTHSIYTAYKCEWLRIMNEFDLDISNLSKQNVFARKRPGLFWKIWNGIGRHALCCSKTIDKPLLFDTQLLIMKICNNHDSTLDLLTDWRIF